MYCNISELMNKCRSATVVIGERGTGKKSALDNYKNNDERHSPLTSTGMVRKYVREQLREQYSLPGQTEED